MQVVEMRDGSDQPDSEASERSTVKPVPVRFRWLKRILAASGVLFVVLLCFRWWWGWEAHRLTRYS